MEKTTLGLNRTLEERTRSFIMRSLAKSFTKKLEKKNAISIRLGITQSFSLVIILITLIVISLFFYSSQKSIEQLSTRISKEIVNQIIQETERFLTLPAQQTKTIAKYASSLYTDKGVIGEYEQIWKTMWDHLLIWKSAQTVFVADENGNYVQVRRSPRFATRIIDRVSDPQKPDEIWLYRDKDYNVVDTLLREPKFDPRVRPWYQGTGRSEKIYWTDVYVFTTAKTPGISASYPILVNGEQKGASVFNIPLSSLSQLLAKQQVSENGVVLVLDSKDQVLAYQDASLLLKTEGSKLRLITIDEFPLDWVAKSYNAYQQQDQKRFVYSAGNFFNPYERYVTQLIDFPTELDWKVLIVIPEMDILGEFYDILWKTIAVSLGILLFGVGWIYVFAKQITRPIVNMTQELRKIRNLDLDNVGFMESRFVELHSMRSSMEAMIQSLHSFNRYVPASLVRQLIELGKEAVIEADEAEVVIFFSDIVDFTTIAEGLDNQELIRYLSLYLKEVSTTIQDNLGTIDKFIGDAVMAFWGAPVHFPNSPYLACHSALKCIQQIEMLNKLWNYSPNLKTRIGLHSGSTLVGNIGCDDRMNYTVIGDNVNLAARLEALNKLYGTSIIISGSLRQSVAKFFQFRFLDVVVVKGKSKSVRIYELIAEANEILPAEQNHFIQEYERGMSFYLAQNWDSATQCFAELSKKYPDDLSVARLLERCTRYRNEPNLKFGEDWDGAVILDSK